MMLFVMTLVAFAQLNLAWAFWQNDAPWYAYGHVLLGCVTIYFLRHARRYDQVHRGYPWRSRR